MKKMSTKKQSLIKAQNQGLFTIALIFIALFGVYGIFSWVNYSMSKDTNQNIVEDGEVDDIQYFRMK